MYLIKMSRFTIFLILGLISLIIITSNTNIATAEGETVVQRGERVNISTLLLQNGTYGDPVPNQLIEFFDQTHDIMIGYDITDSSGLATIDWNIPGIYPLGPVFINATFRGNDTLYLASSCQWTIMHIIAATEIIIDYDNQSLAPGDTLSFSARLLDDLGLPIQDATISVFHGVDIISILTTNSSGIASFVLNCNTSWCILGENTIRLIFEQDLEHFLARTEKTVIVNIQQIQSTIELIDWQNEVLLGEDLVIEMNLFGPEGGLSEDIGIFVDAKFVCNIVTDSFGNGTLILSINNQYSLGTHSLGFFYNGTDRYTDTFAILNFNINSPAIITLDIPENAILGTEVNLSLSILDILGRPIGDTTIKIVDLVSGFNRSIQLQESVSFINALFSITNPVGLHTISLEIENQFLTNGSYSRNCTVWSLPKLTLEDTNIDQYASPNQVTIFTIRMTDWNGNCTSRTIQLLINDTILTSLVTNSEGIVSFSISVPSSEGHYNLSFNYLGDMIQYALSAGFDYYLIVSRIIPVRVILENFEVIHPFQEVVVTLQIVCLNGTLLEGLHASFVWLTLEYRLLSQENGIIQLHLPLPSISGNYSLNYIIKENSGVENSVGFISISISIVDLLAAQGIGINGFSVSLLASLSIILIPTLRKKYLLR
ncbi:MAG: hypothetical protein JW779_10015 [Candidatus Thorarchaeota archaeon]|nr:hypothetical protein [Candidatus Thorarchaeota archaeon]